MPEVDINIGNRAFKLSCNEGEEENLLAAASLLANEADTLQSQIGRVPEARMLLMSGLMLADRIQEMQQDMVAAAEMIKALEGQLRKAEAKTAAMAAAAPKAFPNEEVLMRSYEDAVLRLEELADELEGK